jgi:hypothetical protein
MVVSSKQFSQLRGTFLVTPVLLQEETGVPGECGVCMIDKHSFRRKFYFLQQFKTTYFCIDIHECFFVLLQLSFASNPCPTYYQPGTFRNYLNNLS